MVFELKRMDGQKVLITGGLGFIGSNLALRCVELGADVTLFEKGLENIKNVREIEDKINIIIGDITSYADVEKIIAGKEFIFHLAAQTSGITSIENPFLDIQVNIIGTMNLLEACRKNNPKARIVFSGSRVQLGRAEKFPITEDMKDNPLEIYAANKTTCENYMKIYHTVHGLYTVTLRLGTLFGERQQLTSTRFGITNYFIGRLIKGEDITVFGDGKFIRDYNYIGNVVDAFILAAQNEKANGEVFYIGADQMYFVDMVKGVISAMEKVMGKKGNLRFVPFPKEQQKIDVGDTAIDYGKIKNVLGWEPRIRFKEGIEKTVGYYKERYQEYL